MQEMQACWYRAVAMEESNAIQLPDFPEATWVVYRPSLCRLIQLHDGRVMEAEDISYESDGTVVKLHAPHLYPPGTEIAFQLYEVPISPEIPQAQPPPTAQKQGYSAGGMYPEMPKGFDAPVNTTLSLGKKPGAGAASSGAQKQGNIQEMHPVSAIGAYPAMPAGFDSPADDAVPLTGAGVGNDEADYAANDNVAPSTYRPPPAATHTSSSSSRRSGLGCAGAIRKFFDVWGSDLILGLFIFLLTLGAFVANLQICKFIGGNGKWLVVLAWTLLGQLLIAVVIGLAIKFLYKVICEQSYSEQAKRLSAVACVSTVVLLVFVNAFGIPLAWASGMKNAAENYLNPAMTKSIHCYRNPYEKLKQNSVHFVFLEEPQWIVDYQTGTRQKTYTLKGSDDDGNDNGKRYNYCIAPLKYKGIVPCPQRFWAMCFRQTSYNMLAGCDEKDAKYCGWDGPPNGVTLRVMNQNEEFFTGVSSEDENMWKNALHLTPEYRNPPKSKYSPYDDILVFYNGEGPFEMQTYLDKATSLKFGLEIGACVAYGLVCLGYAILFVVSDLNLRNDPFEKVWDWIKDFFGCDCDFCD